MKIGFFGIGFGVSADPAVIKLIARTTEACGYHSLWAPEHIVLLEQYASTYPYAPNGRMPFPSMEIDFLNPFLALTYAAAVTERIRLGTGVCLLPERQPLTTAKEVATLDKLSGGRFDFGIGIGWLKEEFEALQVPWPKRAERTRDYLVALKSLWTQAESRHDGEFCRFKPVRSYPKPVQRPHPPIIFGGESEPALRRVGEVGDGWWGVNVTLESTRKAIATIKRYADAAGRDAGKLSYAVTTGFGLPVTRDDLDQFAELGVDQMIVGVFGNNADEFKRAIEANAETLIA